MVYAVLKIEACEATYFEWVIERQTAQFTHKWEAVISCGIWMIFPRQAAEFTQLSRGIWQNVQRKTVEAWSYPWDAAFSLLLLSWWLSQAHERKEDTDDEPGMWEETFKSHSDSKPHGTIMPCTSALCACFNSCVITGPPNGPVLFCSSLAGICRHL